MRARLYIDGKQESLQNFVVPDMGLSSSRAEMVKREYCLCVSTDELIHEMSSAYEAWVVESKKDDEICGDPQDELSEAGYPTLSDVLKNADLTCLVFGHYIFNEFFCAITPDSNSDVKYWHDHIKDCSVDGSSIVFKGVCYSSD
ncbi:MAG: hypothetical protein HC887_05425 [Desulfobacteraceae bacterium]|nr:hypothetical protein [Desulfobacteraceae bacterium]